MKPVEVFLPASAIVDVDGLPDYHLAHLEHFISQFMRASIGKDTEGVWTVEFHERPSLDPENPDHLENLQGLGALIQSELDGDPPNKPKETTVSTGSYL